MTAPVGIRLTGTVAAPVGPAQTQAPGTACHARGRVGKNRPEPFKDILSIAPHGRRAHPRRCEHAAGLKRMVRITRDKAELGASPFVTFKVYSSTKATICSEYRKAGREVSLGSTPLYLPIAQAFEEARRYAEANGIPAIWIDDPDRLFEPGQVK